MAIMIPQGGGEKKALYERMERISDLSDFTTIIDMSTLDLSSDSTETKYLCYDNIATAITYVNIDKQECIKIDTDSVKTTNLNFPSSMTAISRFTYQTIYGLMNLNRFKEISEKVFVEVGYIGIYDQKFCFVVTILNFNTKTITMKAYYKNPFSGYTLGNEGSTQTVPCCIISNTPPMSEGYTGMYQTEGWKSSQYFDSRNFRILYDNNYIYFITTGAMNPNGFLWHREIVYTPSYQVTDTYGSNYVDQARWFCACFPINGTGGTNFTLTATNFSFPQEYIATFRTYPAGHIPGMRYCIDEDVHSPKLNEKIVIIGHSAKNNKTIRQKVKIKIVNGSFTVSTISSEELTYSTSYPGMVNTTTESNMSNNPFEYDNTTKFLGYILYKGSLYYNESADPTNGAYYKKFKRILNSDYSITDSTTEYIRRIYYRFLDDEAFRLVLNGDDTKVFKSINPKEYIINKANGYMVKVGYDVK